MSDPADFVNALGRISGKLLSENLERQGVDLTFRNGSTDPDLLYLDVNNLRVGINTDAPVYTLDVDSSGRTTNLKVTTQASLGNILLTSPKTFTTSVGPIHIRPGGIDPVLYHDRLTTSGLELDGNKIGSLSNQNIVLDPNGSGTVQFYANTYITGDLAVSGNIRMDGNLQSAGTLYVGDNSFDTVTIAPDFTQSIIPGVDNTYSLGADAGDSSPRRWAQLHSPTWTDIDNIRPQSVTVSDQMTLNGVNNTIFAIQSNDDLLLSPDTGIVYIERTKWQDNDITNLDNTPLTFGSTGIGYTRFMGTNAILTPAGPTIDRRSTPEVGETRWNTDLQYLECFDGTVWAVATGGGEEVTEEIMEDLANVWGLILG